MKSKQSSPANRSPRSTPSARTKSQSLESETVNRKPRVALFGLLLAVVVSCFANTLWNGFVFDDHPHVLQRKALRSIRTIPSLITSERPLRDASYALDFTLWGERAFGFHLTNILLHGANTLLVFALLFLLTGDRFASACSAAFFAVHPMQVDTVAYVSGRRDLLFTLFYLGGFYSYIVHRRVLSAGGTGAARRGRYYLALTLILFVLSLLSKEMAVSFPLFILTWSLCQEWRGNADESTGRRLGKTLLASIKRDRLLYITSFVLISAYSLYEVLVKEASSRAGAGGLRYWGGSFFFNMLTVIRVHAWYLKQIVFPTPIVQYSGAFPPSTTVMDWRVIVAAPIVLTVIGAGVILLTRYRQRLMAFAILSYFVALLPVSQIVPHHELLADHYLYLPLFSVALLFALQLRRIVTRLPWLARPAYVAIGAILITFAVMTVARNRVYRDDITLWQTSVGEAPTSTRALSSLAGQYATRDPARAMVLFKQCIKTDPSFGGPYMSLAVLSTSKADAYETRQLVENAMSLPDSEIVSAGYEDTRRFRAELNIAEALVLANLGEKDKVEALLLNALDSYPGATVAYQLLADYYNATNKDKEIEILKRQVSASSERYDPLRQLTYLLIEQKKYEETLPYLNEMLALAPGDFYANYNLGQYYRTRSDCRSARMHLQAAQAIAEGAEEVKTVREAITALQRTCP